jgi:hypothetical protein
MHSKNYKTNPSSAARKKENVVSSVRFSAGKRKNSKLERTKNKPNSGEDEPGMIADVRVTRIRVNSNTNRSYY